MPNALARRASAWPMAPIPTIPSRRPCRPVPSSMNIPHCHGLLERTMRSPSPSLRVTIRISAMAMSAVASVNTPGVFVAITPRWRHSATSMLLYPTATFETTFSCGPAVSRNAASTLVVSNVSTASAPAIRSYSSLISMGWSCFQPHTLPCGRSTSRPASGIRPATTIRGWAIRPPRSIRVACRFPAGCRRPKSRSTRNAHTARSHREAVDRSAAAYRTRHRSHAARHRRTRRRR